MPAALIVSHGQPSEPETGAAEIRAFAARVAAQAPELEVHGVSLAEPRALEEIAAILPEGTPLYPLFMADGWFTQVQLPKRVGEANLTRLPPLGCDPALADFAAGWVSDVLSRCGWRAEDTQLVVCGHGSGRSPRPAAVTHDFAHKVQETMGFASLRTGFVEEAPFLAEVLSDLPYKTICLPFFATRRGHVLEDLPEAVAEAGFQGLVLEPIGLHPCIPGFIAQRLRAAHDLTPAPRSARPTS
ncbi:sirohydrochlorin chelatase [Roseobacteraceae bacterium S113]